MISPKAVNQFLNEERDRWDAIKDLNHAELDSLLAEFSPKPDFYTDPYLHQKACIALGITLNEFLFFVGMGGGKTRITLDIIRYHQKAGNLGAALVVVPNVVLMRSWQAEGAKHAPDLTVTPLFGSTQERIAQLEQDEHSDVVVINYQGLLYMATAPYRSKKKNQSGRGVDQPSIDWLGSLFDWARGDIEPVVARRYDLDGVADAHRDVLHDSFLGKLVVEP